MPGMSLYPPAECARCCGTCPPPPLCPTPVSGPTKWCWYMVCHVPPPSPSSPPLLLQTLYPLCSPPTLWAWPLPAPFTTSSTAGTTTPFLSLFGQQASPPSSSETAMTPPPPLTPLAAHTPLPPPAGWCCQWWWSGAGMSTRPHPQAPPPCTLST